MPEDIFKKIFAKPIDQIIGELKSRFFPVPEKECECGKAINFIWPNQLFKCTRCERGYEMIIEVKKVN